MNISPTCLDSTGEITLPEGCMNSSPDNWHLCGCAGDGHDLVVDPAQYAFVTCESYSCERRRSQGGDCPAIITVVRDTSSSNTG